MTRRTLLLFVALLAVGGAVAVQFARFFDDARIFRPIDYMEYQTAGRALLNGQNPYDGAVLYPYQVEIQAKLPTVVEAEPGQATRYADPIMMWNPPWTLPLTVPLGAMHWRAGQLLWTAANLVAVVASAVLLWHTFSGSKSQTAVAAGVAVLFAPTLFVLLLGQISGFLLLGLAGFGYLLKREPSASKPTGALYLAGLLAALTAIKPHLLVPFALVLVLETLRGGKVWRSVVAGGLALIVFGLIPLAFNPHVWSQYREATSALSAGTHNTPNEWTHATLGYWLRTLHPERPFALMFVPLAVALPLVAGYWWIRRNGWNWAIELPRLVLVSLIATPYGAWGFDLVLLLVPVVQAAVWVANDRRAWVWLKFGGFFVAINLIALFSLRFENSMANGWLTPAVAVGYLVAEWVRRTQNTVTGNERPRPAVAEVLPS
ncbi:MAG: DUF2029 domain-containing protein [Fimbriiglobus sp.]|jgi:hypothetical protein|nr:DUF2029 domain-containing protein [Fimbriiglobus sp.]